MPIYEYCCDQCGRGFERIRRAQDADAEIECPFCESEEVERVLSTFAMGGCAPGGGGRFR